MVLGIGITAVTFLADGPVAIFAYGAIAYGMISVSTGSWLRSRLPLPKS